MAAGGEEIPTTVSESDATTTPSTRGSKILDSSEDKIEGGAKKTGTSKKKGKKGKSSPERIPIAPVETEAERKERERQERKQRLSERSKFSGSSVLFAENGIDLREINEDDLEEMYENKKRKYSIDRINEYTPRHKRILDGDYEETIVKELDEVDEDEFDYLYDISSPESIESVYEEPSHDSIKLNEEFLQNFAMPAMTGMSLAELRAGLSMKSLHEAPKGEDVGVFVDPLTGVILPSTSSSTETIESESLHVEEEKKTSSSETLSLPDFSDDDEREDEKRAKLSFIRDDEERDALVEFEFYYQEPTEAEVLKPAGNKHMQELLRITSDFLNDLLNEIIAKSEMVHVNDILRAKCDRYKLIESLRESIDSYFDEKNVNSFLNARTVEYYKRQRNYRVLTDLSPVAEYRERRRYMEALNHFDYIKNRIQVTKRKNSELMASVLMDLNHVQTVVDHTELHFQSKVQECLNLHNSEYLRRIIDKELRQMHNKRNEISDTRLHLITRKHTYGRISEKINALEQVTEDLSIHDFVAIQNQVVALDKKIEERNVELKKLLSTYHAELCQTQHDQEKASIMYEILEEKKAILLDKQQKQVELRESLYQQKMQRTRIHKRQEELSFKGGILSMPALMVDYDETVDMLKEKRVYVAKLKEISKNIMNRVAFFETRQL